MSATPHDLKRFRAPRPQRPWHEGPLYLVAMFGAAAFGYLVVVLLMSLAAK